MKPIRIMLLAVLLLGAGCAGGFGHKANDDSCKTAAACRDMSESNKGGQGGGGMHGGSGGGMGM